MDDEELERGADLRLAQRHRVLTPGVLHGRKTWEAALHSPGTTGSATLYVTTSGHLPKESKFVLAFPDNGWRMPNEPNISIKGPQGRPVPRAKALWKDNSLEITTLDEEIDAGSTLAIVVSGVSTPGCATPSAELVVTTYEKRIVRNTVPPSIRGGQVIDGPTKVCIPALVPGAISGPRRWSPFNCCPNMQSDVYLDLLVTGGIPPQGRILIELPMEDDAVWGMAEHPRVTAKVRVGTGLHIATKFGFTATWTAAQHVLEIVLAEGTIPMQSTMQLTIANVTNPSSERPPTTARVTTLLNQGGGVIDGPVKIEVARISELREKDFALATDAFMAQAPKDGLISLSGVVAALAVLSIKQTEETLKDRIKVTTIEEPPEPPAPAAKKGAADAAPPQPVFKDFVALADFLNFFTTIYAPAFKYGEELRLAAGRAQIDRLCELLDCGCDPNTKDGAGWTALHFAAEHGVLKAVNALAEANADMNARDVAGWTPLMCAASNGHVSVVARLLELGADVIVSSVEGRTALHWAATRGMEAAVSFLLLGGAKIDVADRSLWTPLHCAAMHGNVGCAKLLLDHGANVDIADALGHVAWEYWDAPSTSILQAHLDKLEAMGIKKKAAVSS